MNFQNMEYFLAVAKEGNITRAAQKLRISQQALSNTISRMEAELGYPCAVVATGGLAGRIVPYCRHEIALDDELTLKGLGLIYYKNTEE